MLERVVVAFVILCAACSDSGDAGPEASASPYADWSSTASDCPAP
jgi:hypothetical protein